MRIALAVIMPNITLPIWARLFKRSILPTVDRCRFIVGSTNPEMLELAREVLSFASLDLRPAPPSHGGGLTELYRSLPEGSESVVLEDDCFVTCSAEQIAGYWYQLAAVDGALGSLMAHPDASHPSTRPGGERLIGPDTFGSGLYPNMCFASTDVLRACTDMDWTPRRRGESGHWIGEQLHAAFVHSQPAAFLPQRRLTPFAGCIPVDPRTWDGPWLHVGLMSQLAHWEQCNPRNGWYEPLAAYAVALEFEGRRPGSEAGRVAALVNWASDRPDYQSGRYPDCKELMRRVYP